MIRPDSRSHRAVASLSEVNLTQRQIEVLRLLACGLTATAVARSLGISTHTVNGHLREMFRRSEVPNAVALIAHAYAGGVLAGWPPSVHGWASADAGKPWLSGRTDRPSLFVDAGRWRPPKPGAADADNWAWISDATNWCDLQ